MVDQLLEARFLPFEIKLRPRFSFVAVKSHRRKASRVQ